MPGPTDAEAFPGKDYRDLIETAHQQLGGPIVLVRDNLNTHLTAGMRRCIDDRDCRVPGPLEPSHERWQRLGGDAEELVEIGALCG
ncbi:hypothetical protein GCM10019016_013200 [Streptomyces prasinosporus]|uniref:Tc1-like transposase DDE domain-containing protein n=1 Tax=Streptomyces prasinosporus TaxID=68256 RepID=A0ABP6TI83_9ACTN|nr:hypothetical protein GCM10010332_72290 [Streptomyces albogriseolus]